MQTSFTVERLDADPHLAQADKILKSCQHYGFCTSGCPTYVLLHDELDSPRGRIDLIKEMLEDGGPPKASTVKHLDRCLSCMSCMTTCAVQVDYQHLVDTARVHIEKTYRRPWLDRVIRTTLSTVMPRPRLFVAAIHLGSWVRPFAKWLPTPVASLLEFVPAKLPAASLSTDTLFPALGEKRKRVALLAGCVQPVLQPSINAATIRLLTRFGCEVVIPQGAGCCGSLTLHMGQLDTAKASARRNIDAWLTELDGQGLDAIITNASGCGSTVKDYAELFLDEPLFAAEAARVAAISKDISEFLAELDLPVSDCLNGLHVAYHDACSLRNVQKVTKPPRALLRDAGFEVEDVPEGHFCCGSAGTYNLLQPEIAKQLGERKAMNIASTRHDVVAAGNIGCMTQLTGYLATPIVHTVELLDWAHGGPKPRGLGGIELARLPRAAKPSSSVIPILAASEAPSTSAGSENDVGIW
ncbi:glycolate oxidase subunit GlcF [soil metagenome]